MGRRQYAKLFAPWITVAWVFAWSMLLLQPCCEALAAPVHKHAHSPADSAAGHRDSEHNSIPAPCDRLLSGDLDSGLLHKEVSFGSANLDVVPACSIPMSFHKPCGEQQLTFRADFSPPYAPAVFLTTQRFRI